MSVTRSSAIPTSAAPGEPRSLDVEVWLLRQGQGERVKVTDSEFTFVAVREDGRPRELAASGAKGPAPPARNFHRATHRLESDAM